MCRVGGGGWVCFPVTPPQRPKGRCTETPKPPAAKPRPGVRPRSPSSDHLSQSPWVCLAHWASPSPEALVSRDFWERRLGTAPALQPCLLQF